MYVIHFFRIDWFQSSDYIGAEDLAAAQIESTLYIVHIKLNSCALSNTTTAVERVMFWNR